MAIGSQDAPAKTYGDVLISGVKVPIVLPTDRAYSQPNLSGPHGDWFVDGNSAYRVGPKGEWADLAERLSTPSVGKKLSLPLIIKVFIVTDSLATKSVGGVVFPQRSTLTSFQRDDIANALAIAGGMVRASGFEMPVFDLSVDSSPILNDGADSAQIVREIVAPRVNNTLFSTDEPVYRGPYYGILVIHAGMGGEPAMLAHGPTPVNILPYWSSTETGETGELAQVLFANIVSQIERRDPTSTSSQFVSLNSGQQAAIPNWANESLTFAQQPIGTLPKAAPNLQATAKALSKNAELSRMEIEDATYVFARSYGLGVLEANSTAFSEFSVAGVGGNRHIVGKLKDSSTSFNALLGGSGAPIQQPSLNADGTIPISITGFGDFNAVEVEEGGVKIVRVTHKGHVMRGHVHLSKSLVVPGGGFLSFRVRTKSPEAYAVRFGHTTVISGAKVSEEASTTYQRIPTDGEWQTVIIPMPAQPGPFALAIEPAPDADSVNRFDAGPQSLDFTDFRVIQSGSATQDARHSSTDTILAIHAAQSPAEKRTLAIAAAKSTDFLTKLNGWVAWSQVALPEDIPVLSELAQSASDFGAMYALKALKQIATPESDAVILEVARRGPFDINRLLAFELVSDSIPESWISHVNLLLTNRDWRVRANVVPLANRTQSPRAELKLVTSLPDPDPAVRAAIISQLNPSNDLPANRMLFLAVNDSSEFVRAAAYVRLLDSTIDRIREEASKGVRDESPLVRKAILYYMAKHPKEDFRSALQMAVLDKDPQVLAAVLDAFRQQPGQVVWQEIQSVASASSPVVHVALLRLVKVKQISLPDELLGRLRNSTDPEVARLAREIGG